MKNASAVFGDYTQFSESNNVHLGKVHYYPSDTKELDENSKKIRLNQKYIDPPQQDGKTAYTIIGGENRNVVGDAVPESLESLISFIEDASGSSKYNESWPVTDQSFTSKNPDESTINVTKVDNKEHSIEDYLEKHGENKENQGTLLKFVQRFREQPPLSRTQRYSQKEKKAGEFWWLSSPTQIISSTPISSDSSTLSLEPHSISFSPAVSGKSSISALTRDNQKSAASSLLSEEDSDSATARIQLRTDKLLELSECAVKNTTSSNSVKSQNSLPFKYKELGCAKIENISPFVRPSKASFNPSNETQGSSLDLPIVSKSLKPEDDILYKWRLSHKMNLAAKTASANPFLNFSEVKKYISSEQMEEEPMDQTQGIVEQSKEYVNENVKTTSKREIGCAEVYNNKTCANKVSDSNVSSNHVCCRKTTIQNCNTCLECKDTLSKCTSIKHHRTCSSSIDQSCVCCKLDNDHIQCNCNKPSHLSRCNTYSCHIPPHVHVCDMPCVHKEHTNLNSTYSTLKSQQKNEQTVLENKSMLFDKKHNNKQCGDDSKKKKPEDPKVSSSKNVSPVIKQVISDYLFEANSISDNTSNPDHSTEMDSEPVQSVNEKIGLKMPPVEASSSEDEFSDDEILRELRTRRRNNKDELMMVCERLKRMQEQRTEAL